MTTTTAPDVVEGIDMDAVPLCESKSGCREEAANHAVIICGCVRSILCQECSDRLQRRTQARLDAAGIVICRRCRCVHPGDKASDVLRVFPL